VLYRYNANRDKLPLPASLIQTPYEYYVQCSDLSYALVLSVYWWHPMLKSACILSHGGLLEGNVDYDRFVKSMPSLQTTSGHSVRAWYNAAERTALEHGIYWPPYASLTPETTQSTATMITFGTDSTATLPPWRNSDLLVMSNSISAYFRKGDKSIPKDHPSYSIITQDSDGYRALITLVRSTHPRFEGHTILTQQCQSQGRMTLSEFHLYWLDFKEQQYTFQGTFFDPTTKETILSLLTLCNDADYLITRFENEWQNPQNHYKFNRASLSATLESYLRSPSYKVHRQALGQSVTRPVPSGNRPAPFRGRPNTTSNRFRPLDVRQVSADSPPPDDVAPRNLNSSGAYDSDSILDVDRVTQGRSFQCNLCEGTHPPGECSVFTAAGIQLTPEQQQQFFREASKQRRTNRNHNGTPATASVSQVTSDSTDPHTSFSTYDPADPFHGQDPVDFQRGLPS
jgi:hypothetical protein